MPDEPFLLEGSPNVAFVDHDDAVWTVFDCRHTGDQLVIVTAGSETAAVRVFQGTDGTRLLYRFGPRESRAPEPALMSRQRRLARPLEEGARAGSRPSQH
ncbi:MAG TPA: hypothetical protein VJU87_04680 [Gemmatimonadaceae bacterium]|nr:hypothetical protein [Gemmatimonadaceae bacterium]